jgi:hypothetical protein
MNNTNNINSDISNTNIWGPSAWNFLHTITFNYPNNPTYNDKENYKNFFNNLGFILPCEICKYNYNIHLKTYPISNYLNTKEDLVKWLIIIHNEVNKLHNKPIKSYNEVIKYYINLYNNKDINNNNNNNNNNIIYFIVIISVIIIIYKYI